MLLLVLATSLYLVHYNRRMFQQVAALSRIVDTRLREILRFSSLMNHPSIAR